MNSPPGECAADDVINRDFLAFNSSALWGG